jgi:hypothetical protein
MLCGTKGGKILKIGIVADKPGAEGRLRLAGVVPHG